MKDNNFYINMTRKEVFVFSPSCSFSYLFLNLNDVAIFYEIWLNWFLIWTMQIPFFYKHQLRPKQLSSFEYKWPFHSTLENEYKRWSNSLMKSTWVNTSETWHSDYRTSEKRKPALHLKKQLTNSPFPRESPKLHNDEGAWLHHY